MKKYHKIQSIFKRDMSQKHNPFIMDQWTCKAFEYLKLNEWVFTEKVDGTNIRVMFDNGELSFGGRTENSQLPVTLYDSLYSIFQPKLDLLNRKFTEVCLYGEGYGPKIQSGGKYREDQSFVLFDIKIDGVWLERSNVEDIADSLEIDIVPIMGRGTLIEAIEQVKLGFESTWGNFEAEGYVVRPTTELCTRRGDRIITKIKCRDFK